MHGETLSGQHYFFVLKTSHSFELRIDASSFWFISHGLLALEHDVFAAITVNSSCVCFPDHRPRQFSEGTRLDGIFQFSKFLICQPASAHHSQTARQRRSHTKGADHGTRYAVRSSLVITGGSGCSSIAPFFVFLANSALSSAPTSIAKPVQ